MKAKMVAFLLVIALGGLYFLGNAMTGWVVSQSCCFPPGCSEENLCEAARPNLESPAQLSPYDQLSLGAVLIVGSLALYILTEYRKHKTGGENL